MAIAFANKYIYIYIQNPQEGDITRYYGTLVQVVDEFLVDRSLERAFERIEQYSAQFLNIVLLERVLKYIYIDSTTRDPGKGVESGGEGENNCSELTPSVLGHAGWNQATKGRGGKGRGGQSTSFNEGPFRKASGSRKNSNQHNLKIFNGVDFTPIPRGAQCAIRTGCTVCL